MAWGLLLAASPIHAQVDSVVTDTGLPHVRALLDAAKYADAELAARALLDQIAAADRARSLEWSDALDALVEALWKGGKYLEPESMQLAQEAVKVKEELLGPDDPRLSTALDQLGLLHKYRGDYDAARPLYERSVALREKEFGPEDRRVAQSLNLLGSLLRNQGEYAAATSVFDRALAIMESTLGTEAVPTAVVIFNRANLLFDMGDFENARGEYARGLELWKKLLGAEHPRVATWLGALGRTLRALGDPEAAKPLLEEALAIRQATYGADNLFVAESLDQLGDVLVALGEDERALELHERALATLGRVLRPDHPDVVRTMDRIALVKYRSRDFAAAAANYEAALAIAEAELGADHPTVAAILTRLALAQAGRQQYATAFETAVRAEHLARGNVARTIRVLPERQALGFESVRAAGLDLALTMACEHLDLDAMPALDALVRSRALVLDEITARHRAVGAASDVARVAAAYAAAQQRFANLLVRGRDNASPEEYRALLQDARLQAEKAEADLAQRSARLRSDLVRVEIGITDVRGALPTRSALISFARYMRTEPTGAGAFPAYAAFVLHADDSKPTLVNLGAAVVIDSLVTLWRRAVGNHRHETHAAGVALRRAIWDPPAEKLGNAEQVFVIPDGSLHLVSLGALPTGDSSFLLETGPLLHLLAAERDLVRRTDRGTRGSGLLAVADPDYVLGGQKTATPATPTAADEPHSFRGALPDCIEFSKVTWSRLDGAAREAADIVSLWRSQLGDEAPVVQLTGSEATEMAFRERTHGQRILHVATHGFFVTGSCMRQAAERGVLVGKQPLDEPAPWVGDVNPLPLSGLVLAGANERMDGHGDDGILTAEEIASLDLGGVEWAVLSACETGVGTVQAGEGVFGMRRAFQRAGVGTLIMSLWPAEDESTRDWMLALYRARISRGLSTADAVRSASREVLDQRRRAGKSTHPYYWATFVAAGDWH